MDNRIAIEDIGSTLENILLSMHRDLDMILKTECEETAKELVKDLKRTSPKDTGKYANSWTYKKEGSGFIVYNIKHQLTHILENGHQIFEGTTRGKQKQVHTKGGRVAERPHIAPARDRAEERLQQRLLSRMGRD